MNTPTQDPPIPSNTVGRSTVASLPTVGSIVGSLGAAWAMQKLGMSPLDGGMGSMTFSAIAGTVTALFHAVGAKIGVNLG